MCKRSERTTGSLGSVSPLTEKASGDGGTVGISPASCCPDGETVSGSGLCDSGNLVEKRSAWSTDSGTCEGLCWSAMVHLYAKGIPGIVLPKKCASNKKMRRSRRKRLRHFSPKTARFDTGC